MHCKCPLLTQSGHCCPRRYLLNLRKFRGDQMPEEHVDRRASCDMGRRHCRLQPADGVDEEGTLRQLKAHRKELVDPKITEHRGRIVKTTGDGMLVEIVSVVDAVRCAVEIQRGMVERNANVRRTSASNSASASMSATSSAAMTSSVMALMWPPGWRRWPIRRHHRFERRARSGAR